MSISQNFPTIRPTLNLNFARSKTLDPRITFERASIGTYVDENGLIKTAAADEARFDHDPETGESLGLLIEEARTNYYTTSETMTLGRLFLSSQWTWTSFTEGGPQGGSYMRWERIGVTASPEWNYSIDYNNTGLSIGDKFVVTFYARCPNGTLDSIRISNPDQESEAFNIDSQWRKFTKVFTYGIQSGLTFFRFNRAYTPAYVIGTTYDIACLQIEKYEFPTSYIPTSGSAVTRSPDSVLISPSGWWNYSKGTVYAEFKGGLESQQNGYGRIWSPSGAAALSAQISHVNNNKFSIWFGGSAPKITSQDHLNSFGKIAVSYSNNGTSADIVMGSYPVTTTGTTNQLPNTTTPHGIGKNAVSNTNMLNGYIKKLVYYPEVLTSSQLQNLTK